jgi:hypothetical protein
MSTRLAARGSGLAPDLIGSDRRAGVLESRCPIPESRDPKSSAEVER